MADRPSSLLILSIFKGENFVIKENGCRVFLRAKCADLKPELSLESGVTKLSSSCTDPEFNSQLAWSLSRKQLRELRSNRSTIKVSCILVDERTDVESELGYVVLHVKDASAFTLGKNLKVDVDPSKSKFYNLLGTKESWRSLHPRLQMILHLEDIDHTADSHQKSIPKATNANNQSQQTVTAKNENQKIGKVRSENTQKLAETRFLPRNESSEPEKFLWTVHDDDGYFQLGVPNDQDDLYIINVTVISASYLHKLWDGKSPRKENKEYYWQVKYSAFGCEIASEPFLLNAEEATRRTFIGDKATARIRANGRTFFEYLEATCMEFHVVRHQLGGNGELMNEEIMGFCYVSLKDLSLADDQGLRLCMDVVSEWGTSKAMSLHEKPEVRALLTLQASPNCFVLRRFSQNAQKAEELELEVCNDNAATNGDVYEGELGLETGTSDNDFNRNVQDASSIVQPVDIDSMERDVAVDVADSVADTNISNSSNHRRLLQFESEIRKDQDQVAEDSISISNTRAGNRNNQVHTSTQPQRKFISKNIPQSEESDCDSISNKENLAKIMPKPGLYTLVIELKQFWLKCSRLLEDTFILSYVHPPVGIDKYVDNYGQRISDELISSRQGFTVRSKELSKTITIQDYSESLLNEPLTVEFYKFVDGQKSKSFGTSLIPLGRIFIEKEKGNTRMFSDTADILKSNNVRIGSLSFKIKLCPEVDHNINRNQESAFFPTRVSSGGISAQNNAPDKDLDLKDVKQMDNATSEMREWKRTQEEMFKRQKEEKETAYLKILAEEATKRDKERESVMFKKLSELDKKEKDYNKRKSNLDEKELNLNKLELEVKDRLRELKLQQENFEQHADFNLRRLTEDHKLELDSLHRRVQSHKEEAEKLKTKVSLLEKKLETKEAEIDKLIDIKREQPNEQLKEKALSLQQENKMLREQLKDCNTRKEQCKKQLIAVCKKLTDLQGERDREIRDLNANLRLQILATKEHKELKKERKAVHEISESIKALKKEKIPASMQSTDGKGDQFEFSALLKTNKDAVENDEEIRRLLSKRKQLLSSGAYTQYDLVVKEMEKRMISLSKGQMSSPNPFRHGTT